MKIEVHVPSPGESISEVELATWLVADGTWVEKDQEIAEVESEKATLPLLAPQSGIISIAVEGGTVNVGQLVCTIDTSAQRPEGQEEPQEEVKVEAKPEPIKEEPKPVAVKESPEHAQVKVTPVARRMMDEQGVSVDDILRGLQKVDSNVVRSVLAQRANATEELSRHEERTPMSQLRKKLSQRLVEVKNQTAMLTTFNEVDMTAVMAMRKKFQKNFQETHGVKLGFMSFFTKAVVESLKQSPLVNSYIDNEEIVTPNYYDIGIAVQTPKGLMVPVLRNAETLSLAQMEQGIGQLAEKGRVGRIGLDELTGGTFTITNGGVFGSLLSTPILNPPQSGILGMHTIQERPVAINGKVEIRPMMYIALSYDHRIIDGKDAVGFLVNVKKMIENPQLMILDGKSPEQILLGL